MTRISNTLCNYLELCKPKVVLLMLLTAIVGMVLATPTSLSFSQLIYSLSGIALAASSAAVINHLVDRHIDAIMARTHKRPIASGKIDPAAASLFAIALASISMLILLWKVNSLTAILTFITIIGYAGIYTLFLKRATPQNIVIGGAAGAAPPLLGWTAITGHIDPNALLLVLIIFTWTPPHFWALAIYRFEDYKKANIPMLPVTHGIAFTKLCIFLYTLLLVAISVLPFVSGLCSWFYLVCALLLGVRFIYWAWELLRCDNALIAMRVFRFSIIYLLLLFVALIIDHYLWF